MNKLFCGKELSRFVLLIALIFSSSILANSATFTVTKTADTNDSNLNNGICADFNGDCTFRAAIQEANALAGDDRIVFAIPTPNTITLTLGAIIIRGNVDIVGPGARELVIQRSFNSGTANFRVFDNGDAFVPNIYTTISGITIQNGQLLGDNNADFSGGAIRNRYKLLLDKVVIKNNTAFGGGGVYNYGELYIFNSLISSNTATNSGGGVNNNGTGKAVVVNTTFSQNTSPFGGAVYNSSGIVLINCTISNNSATVRSGGIYTALSSITNLRNTILAFNTAPSYPDLIGAGTYNSLGNNIIGNNFSVEESFPEGNPNINGDKVGTAAAPINPLLGTLQNNGGQTDTHALLSNSPAIDSGNNCVVDNSCGSNNPPVPLTTDQRGIGYLRQFGNFVDIGAFESAPVNDNNALFDFDGDGKSDVSVFRPDSGVWHLQQSRSGYAAIGFGLATDKLVPADFDGDGKTDLAVFRENPADPGKAKFYILQSSNNQLKEEQFGSSGDIPVNGDWDGDGKADIGVYRAGTAANPQGYFYYRPTSQPATNFVPVPFGAPGDKPVVADFDGDGKTDAAVFRPSNGVWYIQRSRDGFYAIQFGTAEDKPVVGDYDGDGKADQAVFRPSNGVWYLWNSSTGFSAAQFGISTDKPVPADYDGDGKTDYAVYRDGTWFILNSTAGFSALGFGNATDKPVPNFFVP